MKLLFDQHLSPRLVPRLADLYPGSAHVEMLGLDKAADEMVWIVARSNQFCIVTKDEDFSNLAVVRGFPPKIVWVQLGNCTTTAIEIALRLEYDALREFERDATLGTFVIRRLKPA